MWCPLDKTSVNQKLKPVTHFRTVERTNLGAIPMGTSWRAHETHTSTEMFG